MSTSFTPEPFDLGEILVKNGLVPQTAVAECLEAQRQAERSGGESVPRLGELLVSRGYLTQEQVVQALSHQEKVILHCPRCQTQVNVQRRPDVREVKCVRCEGTLVEPLRPSVRVTDDSIIFISREPVPREVEEASKDSSRKFGKYTLINEIGRGAVGVVHRAWDHYLNQYVALKRIKPNTQATELAKSWHETRVISLIKEARSAVRLRHPHIVTIYDVGRIAREFYISMEYLEGATLQEHLKKSHEDGKLSPLYEEPRKFISVFRDVARALHYAHTRPAPVVHCDLKPSNIFVDREGHGSILDFGLAKDFKALEVDPAGTVRGTPSYMAPEQASGHPEDIEPRTDVYGVGAMLYELIAGRPPFTGDLTDVLRQVVAAPVPSPLEAAEETEKATGRQRGRNHRTILSALERVVLRCLEKDRDLRYANAKELAHALDAILKLDTRTTRAQQKLPASPDPKADEAANYESQTLSTSGSASTRPGRPARISRWAPLALGALIAAAGIVGGLALGPGRAGSASAASELRMDDALRRFRPDVAADVGRAELARTSDEPRRRELARRLEEAEWVERLRGRVIEGLSRARPVIDELKGRDATYRKAEILRATREVLVIVHDADRPENVPWERLEPAQVTDLVRRALGTLSPADRYGLALYAARTGQVDTALPLLDSLVGTDLEIPAALEKSRLAPR